MQFIIIQIARTSDQREWAFVQFLSFADTQNPLCFYTGAPIVVFDPTAGIFAFPIATLRSCVRVIKIPQGEEDDGEARFWINWWISSGPHYYNEDARFDFLVQHQLLL